MEGIITCVLLTSDRFLLYVVWFKPHVAFKFTTASLGALGGVGFVTVFIQCNLSVSYLFLCVSVCVRVCPQRQDSSPLPHSSSFTFSTEMCHKSPELRVMGPALGNSLCSPSRLLSQTTHTWYGPCIHPSATQYNIVDPEHTNAHSCIYVELNVYKSTKNLS